MTMCPNCGSMQPEGAAFCDECGAALGNVAPQYHQSPVPHPPTVPAMGGGELICSQCGAQLEPDSAFCDMCGAPVTSPAPAEPPPPAYPTPEPRSSDYRPDAGESYHPKYAPPQPEPTPDVYRTPPPSYAAPASIQARLVVKDSNATLPLPKDKAELIVGREDPINGIYPEIDLTDYGGDDKGVSRQHARLFFKGGEVFIEDLGSTNRTYVNREELLPRQPHVLSDGCEIRLGRLKLNFYL